MTDMVILVNEDDSVIGYMKKMEAHELGLLHRAFSVLIFNSEDKMLLQRRALSKYHSGGLWTNTCCSHPRAEETTLKAAHRRMIEEMGFDCDMEEVFSFVYNEKLDKGLVENEFDHVFVGRYNSSVEINPHEVEEYKWISYEDLIKDMESKPNEFTAWFKIIMEEVKKVGIENLLKRV
jgi:isopentenyl-diphosphate delta-isomerase